MTACMTIVVVVSYVGVSVRPFGVQLEGRTHGNGGLDYWSLSANANYSESCESIEHWMLVFAVDKDHPLLINEKNIA